MEAIIWSIPAIMICFLQKEENKFLIPSFSSITTEAGSAIKKSAPLMWTASLKEDSKRWLLYKEIICLVGDSKSSISNFLANNCKKNEEEQGSMG